MSSYVWKYPVRTVLAVLGLFLVVSCGGGDDNGTGPSDESSWVTTVVSGSVGPRYNAIALGSDGHPRIAFIDIFTETLGYARFDGSSWTVETVPGTAQADEGAAIVFDSSDHPHIAWQSLGGIRYAYHDGAAWTVEVVENTVVGARNPSVDIALDASESPAISFYGGDLFGLKFATRSGVATWTISTPDADLYAGFHGTSLLFDASGDPMISYYEYSSSALRMVTWDGSWSMEEVDNSGAVGQYSSMVLDGTGRPHIAYLDETNGTVRYAVKEATGWVFQVVGNGYISPSLDLASDGTPWVAFIEYAGSWVKAAHREGTSWTVESVSEGSGDWRTSLVVGPGDRIHISANLSSGLGYIHSN
ncbi:hypothetical protein ACFL4Y_00760 [Gemmatimonadota bacterium]